MKKELLMYKFLSFIEKNNKLTLFYKIIFNYDILNDYNYISRFFLEKGNLVIDIYDNILVNRFNRYIFNFKDKNSGVIKTDEYVKVTTIFVNSSFDIDSNIGKLSFLFSDNCKDMISFSKTFLSKEFVRILQYIIKK